MYNNYNARFPEMGEFEISETSPGFFDSDSNNNTMNDQEKIELANTIGYGYIAPAILAIGLSGNTLIIIILSNRKRFSSRIYTYLRALAITDIVCLSLSVSGIIHQMWRGYTYDENHIDKPLQVGL